MGFFSNADYTFEVDDDLVTIHDQNLGNISVTNDIEDVLAQIHREIDLTGKKVQYYDSCGQLDRVLQESGKFKGFAPGGWGIHCGYETENRQT